MSEEMDILGAHLHFAPHSPMYFVHRHHSEIVRASSHVSSFADVAQLVEHVHGKDGVASSILAIGSRRSASALVSDFATLAQLVEHLTRNEKVPSSILGGGSRKGIFSDFFA